MEKKERHLALKFLLGVEVLGLVALLFELSRIYVNEFLMK